MPSVYLFATLDTKGPKPTTSAASSHPAACSTVLVDVGALGSPSVEADISRERIFALAGTHSSRCRKRPIVATPSPRRPPARRRSRAPRIHAGELSGVLGLGGSAGTTIATSAMRVLPLGIPKVMLSTLASGTVRQFVGDKDIFMLNAVVDIAGLNRISREMLSQAARAMAGLVNYPRPEQTTGDRPLIAATMFGVTTPCIERARELLEREGFEVLVFHATGNGGQAMESLIAEGLIAGVLDLTTTELADEHVGGFLSAGPDRLTAAASAGIPQVVSTGAVDMVNFYGPASVPDKFADRTFYRHNANVTLMRTTVQENAAIGAALAKKLSKAVGPVAVLLPARGVSAIDRAGQPFDDPEARRALHDAIKSGLPDDRVVELDAHINDPAFAEAAVATLVGMIRAQRHVDKRKTAGGS